MKILFDGVPETDGENCENIVKNEILVKVMNISTCINL